MRLDVMTVGKMSGRDVAVAYMAVVDMAEAAKGARGQRTTLSWLYASVAR